MTELFKKGEKEQKARQEWLNKFKDNFERALRDIDRHHERKLLSFQVVAFALFGAFIINLLTSVVYDLLTSLASPIATQRIDLDKSIVFVSIVILFVISALLYWQLKKYKPTKPFLSFWIKPEDIKPFLEPSEFQQISDYLERGELKDFKVFGNGFFESLHGWFAFMFNEKVDKKPKKEYEEFEELGDPFYKELPTIIKEYDISAMSNTGIKFTLEVTLKPDIVYSWTQEGDKTAAYTFCLIFRFRILNPEHCDANKFLEEYYHLGASDIVKFASISLAKAFRKIGCIKPPKAIKNSTNKET